MPSFTKLNLDQRILNALEKKGYTTPTPIQFQAIPHILEGKDILGIAQTGTGKTAAFSLPILDNLTKSANRVKPNQIRVLILTPTRELASQIAENISGYGKELGFRHAVIFGGVAIGPQIKTMSQGLDILIATPGRLLDLMNQGHIRYSNLEIFVLDEADRMLDMGFIHDVKKIIKKLPEKKQTLFFSATMPQDIADLADSILHNPVKVEVTPQATTVDRIDQRINLVAKGNKNLLLKKILKQDDVGSVLVFSKTKHGANRIVQYLEGESIKAAAIHGNKSQAAREKALAAFKTGGIKVLIATDIAARGIDIPGISHVINFDIPNDPESYVHRIGRTARAGKNGVAISFCDNSEKDLLRSVEKLIKFQIPIDITHPLHGVESSTPYAKSASDRKPAKGREPRERSSAPSKERFSERPARSDAGRGKFGASKFGARDGAKKPAFGSRNRDEFSDRRIGDRDRDVKPRAARSEEDVDLKFNQESSNVNREPFSGYKARGRFSNNGARSSERSGSGFGRSDARPARSGDRNTGARTRSSADAQGSGFRKTEDMSDVYVSNKDGRRSGRADNKGKNFSYAGVREKNVKAGKRKPFKSSWK